MIIALFLARPSHKCIAAFLGVYVIYVVVVFTAEYYKKKKRAAIQPQIQSSAISRRPTSELQSILF